MQIQEVDIVIDKDGQVHLEVNGVKGTSCLDLTRELELALGGDVTSREMRPEAYDVQQENQDQQWQGRS